MLPTPDDHQFEERIIALEEGMMHAEHLLKNLNEVVCEMHDRLDEQVRQLKTLKQLIQRGKHDEPEERSFEDERPPHY